MFDLKCKTCQKIIGKCSKEDNTHLCSGCAEEERLLYVLPKGQICNHDNVTDEKLEEILKKVNKIKGNKLKEFSFSERIEKIKKKLKLCL